MNPSGTAGGKSWLKFPTAPAPFLVATVATYRVRHFDKPGNAYTFSSNLDLHFTKDT